MGRMMLTVLLNDLSVRHGVFDDRIGALMIELSLVETFVSIGCQ
jgi:hypothetical protein